MIDDLPTEIDADEVLERIVSKQHLKQGTLYWKALRLMQKDHGGMSLIRLRIGAAEAKAIGSRRNGYGGFAETRAANLTNAGHALKDTRDGAFAGHADAWLKDPPPAPPQGGWPRDDPDAAGESTERERKYYVEMLPMFLVRVDPHPDVPGWDGEPLGTAS